MTTQWGLGPANTNSLSRDLGLSRYLAVTSNTQAVSAADMEVLLLSLVQSGFAFRGTRQIGSNRHTVYVQFSDIRDAVMVQANTWKGGSGWHATYIRPEQCQVLDSATAAQSVNDGLIFLEAFVGPSQGQTSLNVVSAVYNLLRAETDIFAFLPQPVSNNNCVLHILVELCDVREVATGIKLSLSLYRQHNLQGQPLLGQETSFPSATTFGQGMSLDRTQISLENRDTLAHYGPSHLGLQLHPQFSVVPIVCPNHMTSEDQYILGPFPRSADVFPVGNNQLALPAPFCNGDGRRQNATRVSRPLHHNRPINLNHVDIMLRNIPNKVDQAMLKQIVDESSWGKYDFMYLRIDFTNDCNVGYAFINFVDPLDIIDFVNARGNQRWNCFKSDKVAEISYATIQGKDCLVQKFRNSSVMLEVPQYRPKLYYTSNGPRPELAGQEEPFPPADNPSKMKRSVENAENIGLFTPNAGQHFRDEQRRRRSQFDRGTRLAALEEYNYDASLRQLFSG
ncbi:hypothetical protein VTK73DRAFT_682 [Phialemonium thermophilum]|uniref:Mei2-like C-terminal RNA recognition motif domain-containing protein n=1 Tax=Phialemonium thermophilum TaxID=223376 RepID=A0ABR3XDE3_9PEZI